MGSYAVLPLSTASPPFDWFMGVDYMNCVDPPLGVAQQVISPRPQLLQMYVYVCCSSSASCMEESGEKSRSFLSRGVTNAIN